MIQSLCTITAIKIDTQVFHVPLRRIHTFMLNIFECQKPQILTLNDPKLCEYQKSMFELFFCRYQKRRRTNICGSWIVDAPNTQPATYPYSQFLLKMMENLSLLETNEREDYWHW